MLKKIISLSLAVIAASQVYASDLLSSGITPGCWNTTYDANAHTITYATGQWGGCSWWLNGDNYSQYSSVEVTLTEPSPIALTLVASYSADGSVSDSKTFEAGATKLTLSLDSEKSQTLYSFYIANGELTDEATTITLSSVNINPLTTVTLFEGVQAINWGGGEGVTTFFTVSNNVLKDAKPGMALKITYSLLDGYTYGNISLKDATNWAAMTSMSAVSGYDEGGWINIQEAGTIYIPLNATDIAYLQSNPSIVFTGVAVYKSIQLMPCPIEKTFDSTGYASFSSAYNTAVPDGLSVYTAIVDGEYVDLTKVECTVIPANTGVILYNPSAGSINLEATNSESESDFSDNDLVASSLAEYATVPDYGTAYGLAKGKTEFSKIKAGTVLSPTKAYIYLTTSAASMLKIRTQDESGIADVINDNADDAYYNLQGIRVDNPQHGIYIHAGKKIFVK